MRYMIVPAAVNEQYPEEEIGWAVVPVNKIISNALLGYLVTYDKIAGDPDVLKLEFLNDYLNENIRFILRDSADYPTNETIIVNSIDVPTFDDTEFTSIIASDTGDEGCLYINSYLNDRTQMVESLIGITREAIEEAIGLQRE